MWFVSATGEMQCCQEKQLLAAAGFYRTEECFHAVPPLPKTLDHYKEEQFRQAVGYLPPPLVEITKAQGGPMLALARIERMLDLRCCLTDEARAQVGWCVAFVKQCKSAVLHDRPLDMRQACKCIAERLDHECLREAGDAVLECLGGLS